MANPLVTIAMLSYQHERYVADAVRSLLAQTYEPLQIVICDDASSDRSYEIITSLAESYKGQHALEVSRNETRLGLGNLQQIMAKARGELVIRADSDDVCHPARASRLVEAWQRTGVSMVSSNAVVIDARGERRRYYTKPGHVCDVSLESLCSNGWNTCLMGPTLAWERAVFDRFDPLVNEYGIACVDWILPFRAALLRGIHYVPEPLIFLREHPQSHGWLFSDDRQDDAAHRESHLANDTANLVYMIETLKAFRAQPGNDSPRLAQAEIRLANAILARSVRWAKLRAALKTSGRRLTWIRPG